MKTVLSHSDILKICVHNEGVKGIGPKQSSLIKSVWKSSKKYHQTPLNKGAKLNSVNDVFKHFRPEFIGVKKEMFYVILLDTKNRIIEKNLVSIGSLGLSVVHPREVFKPAIKVSASSIIAVHNHPSGDITPSYEDINITKRLVNSGKLLGITLTDHVIVGDHSYYSFLENRMI